MTFRSTLVLLALLAAGHQTAEPAAADDRVPLTEIPPGKVVLVVQPHHDDHSTDYGMAGLIARMVDEGYKAYYVRASNDEKDGPHGYPRNDMVNLRETKEAIAVLGMEKVISLNWRNDYMNPIPLNELRRQIILLIRKYKPDVVLGHNAWEHYQKNPDHRNVGRALAEAYWMAGYDNVHPEQFKHGLEPHAAHFYFGKARLTWGLGHRPNVAVEFNEEQQQRKEKAFHLHRNVRARPSQARAIRAALAAEDLYVPDLKGLDDQQAAIRIAEWSMEHISRLHGEDAGVKYAEKYYLMGEFYHLPGLQNYLEENLESQ